MKTLSWTGKNGNQIELRAECITKVVLREMNADGDILGYKEELSTSANLELWVDGVKVDSCWNTGFWNIVDVPNMPGYKKIHGIKIGFSEDMAETVKRFLQDVIESGKTEETKENEAAQEKTENEIERIEAERIIEAAERTPRNSDGTLMTYEQAKTWRRRYNNKMNEGGEGYIPEIITIEMYNDALRVIGK